ncbi:MAG: class I SAM-dependent methyltransferase [Thermodesulfobacteria bacterium]|nr:class I SAM-dependent methyltransferase [Thermodesulfobacteriota bacterium]
MCAQNIVLSQRIPEPELMDEWEQVEAYATADFSAPHEMFVDLFEQRFGRDVSGQFLDLGCGPCDVTVRFARRYPNVQIHAVDASEPMLQMGQRLIKQAGMEDRIRLFCARVPLSPGDLPSSSYDGVIINSLLHHLPNQKSLWDTIDALVKKGGVVFVMDLMRPKDTKTAQQIVDTYSGDEPEILKRDFYNSLLAAYRPEEIRVYLEDTPLKSLNIDVVSDRHFIVWGTK